MIATILLVVLVLAAIIFLPMRALWRKIYPSNWDKLNNVKTWISIARIAVMLWFAKSIFEVNKVSNGEVTVKDTEINFTLLVALALVVLATDYATDNRNKEIEIEKKKFADSMIKKEKEKPEWSIS